MELEADGVPRDHSMSYGIGDRGPDDLTEAALRTVLFGEPNPLKEQYMGFAAEIDDPLAPLRQTAVSEEIVRPLSELLITDVLVGAELARRIATFNLGVSIRGRRTLRLAWETPRRYANDTVIIRTIEGAVSI